MLTDAFINSQFSYAPLVWMFAGKIQSIKFVKFTIERFK